MIWLHLSTSLLLTESRVREGQGSISIRFWTGVKVGIDESVHKVYFSQHHRESPQHRYRNCGVCQV